MGSLKTNAQHHGCKGHLFFHRDKVRQDVSQGLRPCCYCAYQAVQMLASILKYVFQSILPKLPCLSVLSGSQVVDPSILENFTVELATKASQTRTFSLPSW